MIDKRIDKMEEIKSDLISKYLGKGFNNGEDEHDEDLEVKVRSCLPSVFVYVYINSTNFTNDSFGKLDFKRIDSGLRNFD